MAKNDNLRDYLSDIADAIRAKKGTTDTINAQDFSEEIASIQTEEEDERIVKCTGHVDAEGLKSIGWDDDDIAFYQKYGVDWNEEDDDYYKVRDDNKALYGVLNYSNISTYRHLIVWLPKIDTTGITSGSKLFEECYAMKGMPKIDTSSMRLCANMFKSCYSLTTVPLLDFSNMTQTQYLFYGCRSLRYVPLLDTSKSTTAAYMFYGCCLLQTVPVFDFSQATTLAQIFNGCTSLMEVPQFRLSSNASLQYSFNGCYSLTSVPPLETDLVSVFSATFRNCGSLKVVPYINAMSATNVSEFFFPCTSLEKVNIDNLKVSISFSDSPLLSKESLLYLITHEAADEKITVILHSHAYDIFTADEDILEALNEHTNIELAKA